MRPSRPYAPRYLTNAAAVFRDLVLENGGFQVWSGVLASPSGGGRRRVGREGLGAAASSLVAHLQRVAWAVAIDGRRRSATSASGSATGGRSAVGAGAAASLVSEGVKAGSAVDVGRAASARRRPTSSTRARAKPLPRARRFSPARILLGRRVVGFGSVRFRHHRRRRHHIDRVFVVSDFASSFGRTKHKTRGSRFARSSSAR